MWYCHSQCGRGGSMFDLEMALCGTEFPAAANEVRRIVGRPALRQVDREPEMKWGLPGWSHNYLRQQIESVEQRMKWQHTAVHPYFDADGRLAYVKVRFTDKQNDKTFRQFGLTSKLGWKSRKQAGKKPILYRLNTLGGATERKAENDQLGRFVEDCCVVSDSFSGKARPLYMCYREWAEGAGEAAITETMFGKRLKIRGFTKVDRNYGAVYIGIALRTTENASEDKL
jgi:hypothetical protein